MLTVIISAPNNYGMLLVGQYVNHLLFLCQHLKRMNTHADIASVIVVKSNTNTLIIFSIYSNNGNR